MPLDEDESGKLRPYTQDEIDSWDLRTRGVRDHSHIVDQFGPDGSSCTRVWSCKWADRYDVVKYMVGDMPVVWDDSGTNKISRVMPQRHPQFDNWIATKATDVRGFKFLGTVDADGVPEFERADITVQYEMCDWALADDDEITDEWERYLSFDGTGSTPTQVGSQYLTLPGSVLKYWRDSGAGDPDARPIPYNVGIVENEEKFSWLWRRLPYEVFVPEALLRGRYYGTPATDEKALIGAINKFANAPLNRRAGSTMFAGVTPMLRPDPTGEGYCWDLKLDFHFKPQRFLHFYYFDTSGATTNNGYYYVAVDAYHTYAATPDDKSLHWVRDFADELFNIN